MTSTSTLTLVILLFFISASHAHVRIDSPKAGDVLAPLSEISIKWTETQSHGEKNLGSLLFVGRWGSLE